MHWNLNTPVETTTTCNVLEMTSYTVSAPETATPTINVGWTEGDMVGDVYTVLDTKSAVLTGDDVVAALATVGAGNVNNAMQTAIFDLLASRGLIPAGTPS